YQSKNRPSQRMLRNEAFSSKREASHHRRDTNHQSYFAKVNSLSWREAEMSEAALADDVAKEQNPKNQCFETNVLGRELNSDQPGDADQEIDRERYVAVTNLSGQVQRD